MRTASRVPLASYVHKQNIGVGLASGKGFQLPVDVAAGPDGLLYVLNRSDSWKDKAPRITVTSYDETVFTEIGGWGTQPGQLTCPTGLAAGPDGPIYVTDEALHTVTVFAGDGTCHGRWGEHGRAPGALDRPSGVACDVDGNVWVVDHGNHRVQSFDPAGGHRLTFGGHGTEPGCLDLPWGICLAPDGTVWVADWGNDRVQAFTSRGRFLCSLGAGLLRRPASVAVDRTGTVLVSDWGNDCVRAFDPAGRHTATLYGEGSLSRWAREYLVTYPLVDESYRAAEQAETLGPVARFRRPTGLRHDRAGRLLVADTGRHRVQIYRPVTG